MKKIGPPRKRPKPRPRRLGELGELGESLYLIVKPGQMPIYFAKLSKQEIRLFVSGEFELYQRVEDDS